MRIGVLETTQKPEEEPNRHISKGRAVKFIARRIAKWVIVGKLLQMVKDDATIRGDWEHFRYMAEVVPAKRTSWKQNLLIHYPLQRQESWF